jgi:hypothetical protein
LQAGGRRFEPGTLHLSPTRTASRPPLLAAGIALTSRRHLSARTIGARVEPGPNRVLRVAGKVAVGAVDHRDARAHEAGGPARCPIELVKAASYYPPRMSVSEPISIRTAYA